MKAKHSVLSPLGLLQELGKVTNGIEHMAEMYEIKTVRSVEPFGFGIINFEFQIRWDPAAA